MGKYSSDSETDKKGGKSYSSRSKRRSTSSSSDSSKSKYRRDKKYKRRSRSKSRDKYSRSRRSRSSSVGTYHSSSKPKYYRSSSKEKYKYKKSPSRDKRDRHRSRRSRSKSYIREYASKPKKRSDSSGSSSSESNKSNPKIIITRDKKKTHTGLPLKQSKNLDYLPDCAIIDNKVIAEINEDKFAPKKFISSGKSKKDEKIVIDLKKQTIKIPEVEPIEPDSIFHHNLFLNEESRMDKWVKELYSYRQKSLQQGQKTANV